MSVKQCECENFCYKFGHEPNIGKELHIGTLLFCHQEFGPFTLDLYLAVQKCMYKCVDKCDKSNFAVKV